MRIVAHLSDLHFGASDDALVEALLQALATLAPNVVAVSGDLTQRARRSQFRHARAFLDALPQPYVVVPGNHDVPLWNVFARFADPLGGFRRYITADRYPAFTDEEVAVFGANTTRSFTVKDGGLRPDDVRHLSTVLQQTPPSAVRVVVCHHPFDPLIGRRARWTTPAPDAQAVNTLVAHGADVLLTGHRHLSYVGHTAVRYETQGRSAIVVEAGTATSVRGRGETNSFNVLRVEHAAVTVERMDWDAAERRFARAQSEGFARGEAGWTQCTPRF